MSIHVCVPVLRRYDLLRELLASLDHGTVRPACVHVIDNGRNPDRLVEVLSEFRTLEVDILMPDVSMGVAESWNWFIAATDDERVIVNDDIVFAPHSLEKLVGAAGEMVSGLPGFVTGTRGHAFSCFLLRDSCVEQVGLFDETISPGYAYFEDCDYEQRMFDAGIFIHHVECGVYHAQSATLSVATGDEMAEHHRKFRIAQENYEKKWRSLPRGVVRA